MNELLMHSDSSDFHDYIMTVLYEYNLSHIYVCKDYKKNVIYIIILEETFFIDRSLFIIFKTYANKKYLLDFGTYVLQLRLYLHLINN